MSISPSDQIDKLIAGLPDWRGKTLATLRRVVHEADPEIVEEWKWMGTPTFYHDGLVLLFNPHKDKADQPCWIGGRTHTFRVAVRAVRGT
jgi:hypothetical protein